MTTTEIVRNAMRTTGIITKADLDLSERMANALRLAADTHGVTSNANTVRALARRGLAFEPTEAWGSEGHSIALTTEGRIVGLLFEATRLEGAARHRASAQGRESTLERARKARSRAVDLADHL